MITSFKGKRISAVMSVIPEQEISFMDEVGNYSFTENQMIKLAKDDQHFGGQRALLLFENPEDVLRAVEGGVPIKTVNVGSMAHSPGKVQPNKVLAFNQEDIDTFNKLKEAGLDFDVRKVPNDTKGNMDEILKKAQEELNKLK